VENPYPSLPWTRYRERIPAVGCWNCNIVDSKKTHNKARLTVYETKDKVSENVSRYLSHRGKSSDFFARQQECNIVGLSM
jgi:hypothetical protein